MRIKRTILALICSSALVLAGCSSSDSDDPSTDAPETESETEPAPDLGAEGDLGDADGEMPEPDTADLPEIIAKVNGTEIKRETYVLDYEAQFTQAVMMSQGAGVDQDELKLEVADMLINRELLVQAADADGLEATDDKVEEVLQEAAAQNGLETVEEFLEMAAEQDWDEDALLSDARNQYLINAYIDKHISAPETSDSELQEQYDEVVELLREQGTEDGEIPDFDDVREELRAESENAAYTLAVDEHLEELRSKADVEVFL